MQRGTILWALGLAIGTAQAWTSGQALAAAVEEAFVCQNQQRERRVELRHAERSSRLPCQVVYWRDARQTDGGRPLWEAENDYGFCIEQTRALLQRLQEGGWSCRKLAPDGTEVATIPAIAPRGEGALPSSKPEVSPNVVDNRGKLEEALRRDLSRLAELASAPAGRFQIAAAELGDLDRDGDADAAVLLTYLSDGRQPAQFLMVYRFDGSTFHPAAKTYLGSLDSSSAASAIERIDDGTIELWFELREQGGSFGRHRQTYVLQDGSLVERAPES
jgi:hypothetical protein